jgi:hypothetical protein
MRPPCGVLQLNNVHMYAGPIITQAAYVPWPEIGRAGRILHHKVIVCAPCMHRPHGIMVQRGRCPHASHFSCPVNALPPFVRLLAHSPDDTTRGFTYSASHPPHTFHSRRINNVDPQGFIKALGRSSMATNDDGFELTLLLPSARADRHARRG